MEGDLRRIPRTTASMVGEGCNLEGMMRGLRALQPMTDDLQVSR